MKKLKLIVSYVRLITCLLLHRNFGDLRNETKFKPRNVHTLRYGIETASFVMPKIWSSIPKSYKECSSVNEFKAKIKSLYPENCPCKLFKNYIYQIGYI